MISAVIHKILTRKHMKIMILYKDYSSTFTNQTKITRVTKLKVYQSHQNL